MPIERNVVDPEGFNHELELPYQLRIDDFISVFSYPQEASRIGNFHGGALKYKETSII